MIDHINVGKLICNYIRPAQFFDFCRAWLNQREFHHIVTLNPEMVMQAENDRNFANAANAADLRVPDGAGLIWARWYLRSRRWSWWTSLTAFPFIEVERVTGVDALLELSRICSEESKSVYLLGGTPAQAAQTLRLLHQRWPQLKISIAPEHNFDLTGPASILADLKAKSPNVLFVAYGAPKQTLWIEKNRRHLTGIVNIAVGVGGAFAILSEENPRAPRLFQRLNFEWLWRLWLEPGRIKRIFNAVVLFPLLVEKQKKRQLTEHL